MLSRIFIPEKAARSAAGNYAPVLLLWSATLSKV